MSVGEERHVQLGKLWSSLDQAKDRFDVLGNNALSEHLAQLSDRLSDRRRYVAVFGAFSAGKSSLINAMLGRQVLSVSPHPTTAAITEVELADDGSGSDSVRVLTKTSADMWEDVSRALHYLHIDAPNLEGGLEKAAGLKSGQFPAGSRRHVSFLRAAASGYERMAEHMGEMMEYPVSELESLTADESLACYIQRVRLQVPVAGAPEELVLVDTPGVDSIHRRHTDIAFDYMRHADAVVFVLYYNHAFARADEAFLAQLAEVQNIVGVNKLFLVINAVDLAKNEEERLAVRQRVHDELHKLGIVQPRIYEVSSQIAALTSHLAKNEPSLQIEEMLRQRLGLNSTASLPDLSSLLEQSGVSNLFVHLTDYLQTKASELAYSTLVAEYKNLRRSLAKRLSSLKQLARQNETERQQVLENSQALATTLRHAVAAGNPDTTRRVTSLAEQWRELAFHAGERIRLSLGGMLRDVFHPSQFRQVGNARRIWQQASTELCEQLNRKIEDEIRTLAMRMDVGLNVEAERLCSRLEEQVSAIAREDIHVPRYPVQSDDESLPGRANLDGQVLAPLFRHFSNPRQFFEGDGLKKMMSEAAPILVEQAASIINEFARKLGDSRTARLQQYAEAAYEQVSEELVQPTDESFESTDTLIQYEQTLHWVDDELHRLSDAAD